MMIWRIFPHTHTPEVRFTLEECQNILSRRVEIQRARRPGRHKDADVQILRFAELFAPVPDTCQVQSFPYRPKPEFNHWHPGDAHAYQESVAKLLRKEDAAGNEPNAAPNRTELTFEQQLQQLEELLRRNEEREQLKAVDIDVPLAWQGPLSMQKH